MDVIVIKTRQNYRNEVSPMDRMILAMYLSNNNDDVLEKFVDFENILLYFAIWNNEASSNNSILSNKWKENIKTMPNISIRLNNSLMN